MIASAQKHLRLAIYNLSGLEAASFHLTRLASSEIYKCPGQITFPVGHNPTVSFNLSHTPNTSDQFALLRKEVEQDTYNLDSECKHRLQTLTKGV